MSAAEVVALVLLAASLASIGYLAIVADRRTRQIRRDLNAVRRGR